MADDDVRDAIEQNAVEPAEAHGDGRGMKQHKLRDQIEADKYLRAKAAAASRGLPIRVGKLRAPGPI